MSEYISHSRGPGSIAALIPGTALRHPPTISSNDPRGAMAIANKHIIGRDIKVRAGATKGLADPEQPLIEMTHGARAIRRLQAGGMGMSEYIRRTYGPGDIAALPPTIGSGDGGPTIGAEDVGHQIKQAFPFHQRRVPGATMVEAAGVKLPMHGMGTEGNGNGLPAWALPVGIGLVIGGLYVMFAKKRDHGGILPNCGYGMESN